MSESFKPVAGCYIDLFEKPGFLGNMRRLSGPATYRVLRATGDQNDRVRIESVIAGPSAYVMCFEDRGSGRQRPVWLLPGESIEDWASAHLSPRFDSFRLLNHPPAESDPHFATFASRKK